MTDTIATANAAADRGHGAARHWGQERAFSAAALALTLWLIVSLLRLPSLDVAMVTQWLKSPLAAVPMLLFVFVLFRHIQMGFVQVIEDYVHEEGNRLLCLALVHGATIFCGLLAVLAVLRIVLGVAVSAGPAGPGGA